MRPSRDKTLMDVARVFGERSTCSRASVGAVFSIEGRVLSTGYNGAPAGMQHCNHQCTCTREFSRDPEIVHWPACPARSDSGCTAAVHAESNAVAWAARFGIPLLGSELHVTLEPCPICALLLVNTGVKRVVYNIHHRVSGTELLRSAGISVQWFDEANQSN